ncbi:protein THEM6-like [Wyeomyia smithii]|uniref:protein THEM6-like n=1 Tax=Wyeomyia smithii TaxID=174621 RepID=UPI002467F436|nr:protein THEM6-like [Wyeomyia smithii]
MWWIVVLLYVAFDLNYFIRTLCTIGSIALSRRNLKLTETITTYGICTTQDIDIFLNHMNNVRFLRELDFARYQWYGRCRFWTNFNAAGGSVMQGATMIRYRKMISLLQPFRVETRLVWWDEKSLYFEHKFITLLDGFIRAIAFSKQVAAKVNLNDFMGRFEECLNKPPQPDEIRHWLAANEVSSLQIRKDR